MRMVAIRADPADMVVMSGLRRTSITLVADNLRAALAELVIHRRLLRWTSSTRSLNVPITSGWSRKYSALTNSISGKRRATSSV